MVLCNPRDREAAHRAEMEGIATDDPAAVTCRKCQELLYKPLRQRREHVNPGYVLGRLAKALRTKPDPRRPRAGGAEDRDLGAGLRQAALGCPPGRIPHAAGGHARLGDAGGHPRRLRHRLPARRRAPPAAQARTAWPPPSWSSSRRSLAAEASVLVEVGVIPSAEVLSRVIPQITAQVRSAGIADLALRRLYQALYGAFRRRRSLLLLDRQSQVKLSELPWVAAIDAYRQSDQDARERARQTLEQVVGLAVTAFPQQILPNKLLQEIRTLAEEAGLKLPIVDEVAADIFMDEFSEKFLRSAQTAAAMLGGSLYEHCYALPYARVRAIDDVKASRYGAASSPAFVRLCTELAGAGRSSRGSVA